MASFEYEIFFISILVNDLMTLVTWSFRNSAVEVSDIHEFLKVSFERSLLSYLVYQLNCCMTHIILKEKSFWSSLPSLACIVTPLRLICWNCFGFYNSEICYQRGGFAFMKRDCSILFVIGIYFPTICPSTVTWFHVSHRFFSWLLYIMTQV